MLIAGPLMVESWYLRIAFKWGPKSQVSLVGSLFNVISKLLMLLVENFENVQRKMKSFSYKVGVGSLMYATVVMRANITFVVSMVSQFMSKAGLPHWMAMKHIMRYMKSTLYFNYTSEAMYCLEKILQ